MATHRSSDLLRAVTAALLLAARLSAQTGPPAKALPTRLTVEPRGADGGSLVRVTIDRLGGHGDSVVSVDGAMAGERLHFFAGAGGRMQALGAIPIDAADSIVAQALVHRASGAIDSL